MSVFPLLKGVRLRATKIDSCGLPIAGPANRLVTDGFVQVTPTANMKAADDIEQTNAEGKVCVKDRTPPIRKWYDVDVELCQVNTGLISMFTGWPQVLNYNDEPVGFRDSADVDDIYGVAIEIWTGGRGDDECPVPETDDIFSSGLSGRSYGYAVFGGIEWRISSNLQIQAAVTTVTLSGLTVPMTRWGRGPYNVVEVSNGVAGRLLTPFSADPHIHVERTPIAPPEVTVGDEPEALAIASIFTGPNGYFTSGGVDIAPAQPVGSGS